MATTRQGYNEDFLAELSRLNPSQREAVEQIEGPVMVIAGPGTGKTHLLSARIGRILMETDARPNNILCLTFTDAGVQAMRQRLLQLIGPEAHRVHIFTFHAFCNGVIQDNLEYFGRRNLEPLSDLERVEIIRQLIDDLPVDHPLKYGRSDPYFYESHLTDLLQRMKTENWTVTYVEQQIDAYLADLPNRPEYVYQRRYGTNQPGDLKQAHYQKEVERMERLRAAAGLLPYYQATLLSNRRYDYDDMLQWVLAAFRDNEMLLRTYQEQYLYLLVDEFQDTNGAQNEILLQLAAYWSNPNIFIVGDDDQSIYEFQGARLRNLADFYHRYAPDLSVVLLTDNYRSSQPLLDAAYQLINYNERRITAHLRDLGIDKRLLARSTPPPAATQLTPHLYAYPTPTHQDADLLEHLREWHASGIGWGDMAVIYARHRQVTELQLLLDKAGIPYQTRRRANVLDSVSVRQLRTILTWLRHELDYAYSGEHLLFQVLHYRCFGLPPSDLARLSLARAQRDSDDRIPWRALLAQPSRWPDELEDPKQLQKVADWLLSLPGLVDTLSLPALVEQIINRSGLMHQASQAPDRALQIQTLKTFFDFVRAEVERRPRLTLVQLLDTLERMDGNRLRLPLQYQAEMTDAVTLVTAHSAKGLEYEAVWVYDCISDHWEPRSGLGSVRFSFPDTLTLSGEEDAMEASRRLFYVAMTRAKRLLYLSYAERRYDGKENSRTVFIDELLESDRLQVVSRTLPPEQVLMAELLQLQLRQEPTLPLLERDAVAHLLARFRLSVSALQRYLACPVSFFYEVILEAPQLQSEAASYGLALHNALQRYFDSMRADAEHRFPSRDELLHLFEREMEKLRAYFSAAEYQRRREQGLRNLAAYHATGANNWPRRVRTEVRVRHAEVNGVPLTGSLDRLDYLNDHEVMIVDYKTGRRNPTRLRPASEQYPQGGNYWRQLVFYKLLYEGQASQLQRAVRGQIIYLDPDAQQHFHTHEVAFTPEATEQVRSLITEVYAQIMDQQFYTGCGESSCRWCRFLRQDLAVDSFSVAEVEELDDI